MKKLIKGINDLATVRPDLTVEWHPTKNGDLNPCDVTCGAKKEVWWYGKCGHEYKSLVSSRAITGCGCPICAGRVVLAGFNDLESQFPKIARTWDYDSNGNVLPSQVIAHSSKSYYWKCDKGHSYKAIVNNRVNGSGCPYCAGKAVLKGFNDLEFNYPELANEWDITNNKILPSEVIAHSHKKYQWICSQCGYEWVTSPDNRTRGNGCPKCKGKNTTITGYNDLATKRPDLLLEWNYEKNTDVDPKKIAVNSHKKVWWKCKLGHEWQSVVENRTLNKNGCPKCTGYLRTSFPEQAIFYYVSQHLNCINSKIIEQKELDIYIESMHVGIEYDGVNWHQNVIRDVEKNRVCSKNGIRLLRIREKGCPALTDCEYIEVIPGDYTDLKSAIYWVFNRIGLATPDVNLERDRNCIISLYENNRGKKSFSALYPKMLEEWDYEKNYPLKPEMISYGSQKKVWWRCKAEHSYQMSLNNKTKGANCPYCSNKVVLSGYNDFCTTYPNVAKDWDYSKNEGIDPTKLPHSSLLEVWWKCEKGHEWKATIAGRCNSNGQCRLCSAYERSHIQGEHTLSSKCPQLLSEWNYELNIDYSPDTIAAHSNKKVWWRCKKGHNYRMTVNNKTNGSGCPYCKMKPVRNIDTGEIFESITAAADKYECDITTISRCAHGKQKTASGYRWELI